MKNDQQLKSEKITESLRGQLYSKYWSKHQKQKEASDIHNIISDAIMKAYLKEFFENEEEIKLFHKHKNAFYLSHIIIPIENFGINLKAMGIDEKRNRRNTYNISISGIPLVSRDQDERRNVEEKLLNNVLDNQGIRESITNLVKDYAKLTYFNETICDKYLIGMPQNFWRESEYFCKDCTTTLQLKNKYPEIYELYLETVPFLLNKEESIKELRNKLGFN